MTAPETAPRSGARLLVSTLERLGVEVVFGYPGGAIMPVYDALAGSSLRHILVRHEQAAVHAAEGYARSTGKPGVVLVTSGPGATNAVTGLVDALMDSIPVICLTGQVPTTLIECARQRNKWQYEPDGAVDLVDVVLLASPYWTSCAPMPHCWSSI